MTVLDRARMDWSYVTFDATLFNPDVTRSLLNEILKINPRHKFVVRVWPVAQTRTGERRHLTSFLDYRYNPERRQAVLDNTSRQIRAVLDHLSDPSAYLGTTFLEELPFHFSTGELDQEAPEPLPWQIAHYREQISKELGKPVERWDEELRRWWAKAFVEVINEINAHIRKESGDRMVFVYLQANHRTLDWLAPGESIAKRQVLAFRWTDVIKPGVADGFFAFPNNEIFWNRYLKLSSDHGWPFFSQVPLTPLRLCSWEEVMRLAKTRHPGNLGYFFYIEGSDAYGAWNDAPWLVPEENSRRLSTRFNHRRHAAREDINMEMVRANLQPEIEVDYDFSNPTGTFHHIYVYIRNTRDASWFLDTKEATLRGAKVTVTVPQGLALEVDRTPPATLELPPIPPAGVSFIPHWATRVGTIAIHEKSPLTIRVEAPGMKSVERTFTALTTPLNPPQTMDLRRSGEGWAYTVPRAAKFKTARFRITCLRDQLTMPALTVTTGNGPRRAIWMGTIFPKQELLIGPGRKATLIDNRGPNPVETDVTDRLGGAELVLLGYSSNQIVFSDDDMPSVAPKVRVAVETDPTP